MVTGDLDKQLKNIHDKITNLNIDLDNMKICANNLKTPVSILDEYIDLLNKKPLSINKKRKEIERHIQQLQDNYKFIEQDKNIYKNVSLKQDEINELDNNYKTINTYITSSVYDVLSLLKDEKYIECQNDILDENTLTLTISGKIATQLREIHCLIFSKLLEENAFDKFTTKQIVTLLSIFTNINVKDEFKDIQPKTNDIQIKNFVNSLTELYTYYQEKELKYNINTGFDYNIHYDLLDYIEEWCDCDNIESCKLLLQKISVEKEIFLGEFVKSLLKINNISCEMEKICEMIGNISLLSKLKEIPIMTLKYVITNQSLYV
jgi:superfamily II RNA helicase